MSDIFLSYKSEDKAKAQIIAAALERKGYSVWWDRDIYSGDIYDQVIQEQLDAAKCVMVLWSIKSVKSNNVRAEATYGENRLVPVLIEEVKIPVPFNLIQYSNLIGWKGDQTNPEFLKLLKSVSKKLDRHHPAKNVDIEFPDKSETSSNKNGIANIPKNFTNSVGMKFTLIPTGDFMMGSEESKYEKPVNKVTISNPFYLGIYPVTQHEWNEVMKNNPSYFKGDKLPVEQVSWNDVQIFIRRLNEKEETNKYRLPSEAEWEYAACAGTNTHYSFGDDESKLGDYAWYAENSGSRPPQKGDYLGYDKNDLLNNKWNGKSHPVGEKKPNFWGLYDMHGNVWEWVQDKCHKDYIDAPIDGSPWESGDNSIRVDRGGGWGSFAKDCRSSKRDKGGVDYSDLGLGFRLLRIL